MAKGQLLILLAGLVAGALLASAATDLDTLAPLQTAEIRGRLLEQETRNPLSGGVNWVAGHAPGTPPRSDVIEVGEDGSFVLKDLPPGPIALVGWSGGYGQAFAFLMADKGGIHEVELLLPVAASVEGTVVDSRGYPVSNATVRVRYLERFNDRLRGGEYGAIADRARAEGYRISIQETDATGGWPNTSASEGKEAGAFRILGIDPERPFKLLVIHETLGELESEPLTLAPGQELEGMVLAY